MTENSSKAHNAKMIFPKMIFIGIVVGTLLIDQMIKFWIQGAMLPYEVTPVTPFFNLRFSFNTGVSFSMFADLGRDNMWILAGFAIALSALLTYWAYTSKRLVEIVGYAFIVGGALGNVFDRLYIGAVVDYLDFYYGDWHFPTFNGADVFINVGVFILIVDMILDYQNKDKKTQQ